MTDEIAEEPKELEGEDNEVLKELQDRPIVFRQADQFISYYANSAQFRISFFDIGIVFGQIVEASKERLLIENQIVITMSPQHAKVLLDHLKKNVAKYEETYGPISEPSK